MAPRVAERRRLTVCGAVQGVGFRPFVYRLAVELDLSGWVRNSARGVVIEVEGDPTRLRTFQRRVRRDRPPLSVIQSLTATGIAPLGARGFEIQASAAGEPTALVLPDIATCPDCLREIFDPANRRYRYPFTNCTHCGPRFSIIRTLPYDRANTTMERFSMCARCLEEFHDPGNRRFHAQPNACPACGPQLALWDREGHVRHGGDAALRAAADALRHGEIVAVKGLGGFQLLVDARSDQAVRLLRSRKAREEKPLALLFPGLDLLRRYCRVGRLAQRLLTSAQAPIVLLPRSGDADLAPSVAPENPYLGVMLPYTPLHHLLMAELGFPVVATSGNLSEEPICTDEREALERLGGIADCFLVHDRPIARHVDDSVVALAAGRELPIRRARGYAPLPVRLAASAPALLAVGAHQKDTTAVAVGRNVLLSQHIGDLQTAQAFAAFRRTADDLRRLYDLSPEAVVCDAHPDYLSTQFARRLGPPVIAIQHHHAHVLACLADNELHGPALGVAWDGTGLGTDGTLWGGEFFQVTDAALQRAGHLRTFPLPGGERAALEPRRAALGLLHSLGGPDLAGLLDLAPFAHFTSAELGPLRRMLDQGINTPLTSSVGRLFDAVAALLDLRQVSAFEGQAAMALEFAAGGAGRHGADDGYPFPIADGAGGGFIADWGPAVEAILRDLRDGVTVTAIASRFHNALVELILQAARWAGQERVLLSGGCFQNRLLTERAVKRLRREGLRPYWHRRVPPNDGGIALGQVIGAMRIQRAG
jgi:hydrogenase maturation protein HypF